MEQGGLFFYITFACLLNSGMLLRLVRGGSLYMAPDYLCMPVVCSGDGLHPVRAWEDDLHGVERPKAL